MQLAGKHIIVGISGGIAAYKTASIVRLLVKEGAEVKVVMTNTAKQFITPLTMATLSKHPVMVEFFDPENGAWNNHVNLGQWADLLLIAPATANTIAKMANGIADNLLLTTYLSVKCPVMLAPAMDRDMYSHPATTQNLQTLRARGHTLVEPTSGELASGLQGKGRMQEPQLIVNEVIKLLNAEKTLEGKVALLTSGPTHEPIDPVRFIGNHSSGKMGAALATELAKRGAKVVMVSGPVEKLPQHPNIQIINVTTAQQMYEAATKLFPQADMAVMVAAVADFTPQLTENQKIKRTADNLTLELKPTTDIAQKLGAQKRDNQLLVGFALETNNADNNARHKLATKNLDLIVLNAANEPGAGFKHDTNKISVIERNGQRSDFEMKLKTDVAKDIVDLIEKHLNKINQKTS